MGLENKIRHSFRKEERLKSSKTIKLLFSQGNTFLVHPFKVNWLPDDKPGSYPVRVLIGVSRRNFKTAVERNHMRRLIREAYRKNKYLLYDYLHHREKACSISLIYIGNNVNSYSGLEEKIIQLIKRLISDLERQ